MLRGSPPWRRPPWNCKRRGAARAGEEEGEEEGGTGRRGRRAAGSRRRRGGYIREWRPEEPRSSGLAMSFCAFSGGEIYQNHFEAGIYVCSKCGYELFSSKSKYAHSSPWPAFTETIHADSISKYLERPAAFKVSCGKCGNGLGHEFINDGPKKGLSRF
uniref:Methionine sulfoxide reductase B1 n=1 Tax=Salvator merianae TaxID=96440 RepID=A0A8D0DU36_SALMN